MKFLFYFIVFGFVFESKASNSINGKEIIVSCMEMIVDCMEIMVNSMEINLNSMEIIVNHMENY